MEAAPARYQARYQRLGASDSDGEEAVELRGGPGRSSLQTLLHQHHRETCARISSALVLLALALALAFYQMTSGGSSRLGGAQVHRQDGGAGQMGTQEEPGDSPSMAHTHARGVYHHAALITSSKTCSRLGKDVLVAGGNVVDAGIAAALCLGLVHPHAGGLGGVFSALLHNASSGSTVALNAVPRRGFSRRYGLPVALPGLHLLHRHFGRLAWPRLLEGPVALAQRGVRVDRELALALRESAGAVKASGLCSLFCDGAGEPKGQGALVTHPRLAALLRAVASGDDALPQALAPDLPPAEREPFLQAMGDLGLELQSPLAMQLGHAWLYGAPAPAAGSLLASVLQEVWAAEPRDAPDPCLRALSAAWRGYSRGLGGAVGGGPSPRPPRPGRAPSPVGSHLAVADSQGNVLLLSASLNSSFGSKFLAPASGIVLSDLTAPAGPGLLSWACPVVLSLGEEGTVVGLGATGGSAAPLALAQAIINQVYLGQPLQEALESPWLQLRGGGDGASQGCGPGTRSNLSSGEWAGGALQAGPWVLQVASQGEHARAFAAPAACCHHEGY
ncbi:alpha-2-macroglobulin-like protein 1 [Platysternon megacephalum]|uniref:Alpha-2-macroglobulin-like protein 1 n=1 Tax=Platysternon megacephalum TaxID=55544 RepID=A0A4D9DJ10_9SAUR|nr:alpha-2-macroglobulin-like protein 1 [Platysternon megacephalum]